MINFIRELLSNNTQSSIRFVMLVGLCLSCIIVGFFLWLSVKYVSFGLDIQVLDKLTYLIEIILGITILGKTISKFAESKQDNKEQK